MKPTTPVSGSHFLFCHRRLSWAGPDAARQRLWSLLRKRKGFHPRAGSRWFHHKRPPSFALPLRAAVVLTMTEELGSRLLARPYGVTRSHCASCPRQTAGMRGWLRQGPHPPRAPSTRGGASPWTDGRTQREEQGLGDRGAGWWAGGTAP